MVAYLKQIKSWGRRSGGVPVAPYAVGTEYGAVTGPGGRSTPPVRRRGR